MLLGTTDWAGFAAVIAAFFGGIASVIAAWQSTRVKQQVSTPDGQPPLGETLTNVAAAVTTPPDTQTLGVTMAHVHDVVCDEKD